MHLITLRVSGRDHCELDSKDVQCFLTLSAFLCALLKDAQKNLCCGFSELIVCSNMVGDTTYTDDIGGTEIAFLASPELILWLIFKILACNQC